MSELPVPTLVQLEYLTRDGWVVGHKGIALLQPARYVERLAARGKVGRATALDDQLQPTGQVWAPSDVPSPDRLYPTATAIPAVRCGLCSGQHQEGVCLL